MGDLKMSLTQIAYECNFVSALAKSNVWDWSPASKVHKSPLNLYAAFFVRKLPLLWSVVRGAFTPCRFLVTVRPTRSTGLPIIGLLVRSSLPLPYKETAMSNTVLKIHPHVVPNLKITDLHFVKDTKDGRKFWSPKSTGSYAEDCAIGQLYAAQFITYLKNHDSSGILCWIISEMPRKNTGVEAGFLNAIAKVIKMEA